jgi:hypothetical protein
MICDWSALFWSLSSTPRRTAGRLTRKSLRGLFLLIGFCSATPSLASTADPGLVSNLLVSQSLQLVYFVQNNNRSTKPACATSNSWVFGYTSVAGQGLLSPLLSGYVSKANIYISGTGTCSSAAGYETVDFITLP